MTSTTFIDDETVILASWAQPVNDFVYRATALGTSIAHLQSYRGYFWTSNLGCSEYTYDFIVLTYPAYWHLGLVLLSACVIFSYPFEENMYINGGAHGGFFIRSTSTYINNLSGISQNLVAPVNYPRIDRIVISESDGASSYIQGTEDPSPSAPAIPSGNLPLARVNLYVGMTIVTQQDIVDERTPFVT